MGATMKLILSPCGTSILTNLANPYERKLVFDYANATELLEGEAKNILTGVVSRAEETLSKALPQEASKLSAEINGIFHIYDGDFSKGKNDVHILLATDTVLGRETAFMVKKWLVGQGIRHVEMWDDFSGLRTDSVENFHLAIAELARRLAKVIPEYKNSRYRIIFNLTGGFKSIQGVLQTFAQFYADEAVYIFETGKELLRIPKIPVSLDVSSIERNLRIWRRLSLGLKVNVDECQEIPDIFLLMVDNDVTLSPWGELVWGNVKREIYEKRLWDPPSDRIKIRSQRFEREVNDLPKDRRYEINKRMDELALHLEKEDHPNPKSLNCHKLSGDPVQGCTHEIYAWSDGDARRIFGICKGHREFEIVELEKHLK